MVVIGQHGVGTDLDGKDPGELGQTLYYPVLAVFIVLAR
jgi:hypothetical protein